MNLRIRERLIVLGAVPLLTFLAIICLRWSIQSQLEAAAATAHRTDTVMFAATDLASTFSVAQNQARAFLQHSKPALKKSFDQTRNRVSGKVDALQASVARDETSTSLVSHISDSISAELNVLQRLIGMASGGHSARALSLFHSAENDRLLEAVDRTNHSLWLRETRLKAAQDSAVAVLWRRLDWFAKFGVLLLLTACIIADLLVGRRLVRGFSTLTTNAGHISGGNELAPPLGGKDEIAILDRALHRMAALLKDRLVISQRYRLLTERALDSILFVRRSDLRLIEANSAAVKAYGYNHEELLKIGLTSLHPPQSLAVLSKEIVKIDHGGSVFETVHHRKDGSTFPVEVSALSTILGGEPVILCIIRDVTERKAAQETLVHTLQAGNEALTHEIAEREKAQQLLRHAAFHDELTGLPNRALFMDRLTHMVARLQRRNDHFCAVLFLDLDRFKIVNDSLGHGAGDELLVAVARRLERCLRPGDSLARLGGDEFTILLDDIDGEAAATSFAERILEQFKPAFSLTKREVFMSASVGIAISRTGFDRPEDVLRDADIAMYRAKELGKERYQIFRPELHARASSLLELDTDLRLGLERGEFRLLYQPIVELENGEITGFEALLRWQHAKRGLVNPDNFIAEAEDTGAILAIGEWVLNEACRQAAIWQSASKPLITINVNVSSKQLCNRDLCLTVERALTNSGLPARNLNIEITETAIMDNFRAATRTLNRLREMGVQVQLDDFGTGYSSLSHLQKFPIDALKIDGSFISTSGHGITNLEIVKVIISLAHSLSMSAIAEGIETRQQLAELRALQCDSGQGFYFSHPVDARAACALLAAGPIASFKRAKVAVPVSAATSVSLASVSYLG